jgi:hypothetical protein
MQSRVTALPAFLRLLCNNRVQKLAAVEAPVRSPRLAPSPPATLDAGLKPVIARIKASIARCCRSKTTAGATGRRAAHFGHAFGRRGPRGYAELEQHLRAEPALTLAGFKALLGGAGGVADRELRHLFDHFQRQAARPGIGTVPSADVLRAIRAEMSPARAAVVLALFGALDPRGSGLVDAATVAAASTDTSGVFLDLFECGAEAEGFVSRNEFLRYHANVSAAFDDDDRFARTVRGLWNVAPTVVADRGTLPVPEVAGVAGKATVRIERSLESADGKGMVTKRRMPLEAPAAPAAPAASSPRSAEHGLFVPRHLRSSLATTGHSVAAAGQRIERAIERAGDKHDALLPPPPPESLIRQLLRPGAGRGNAPTPGTSLKALDRGSSDGSQRFPLVAPWGHLRDGARFPQVF